MGFWSTRAILPTPAARREKGALVMNIWAVAPPPTPTPSAFAFWAASKRVMPSVRAATDAHGDGIPIAAFLILADVLKAGGWCAQQLVHGVRCVFEHELMT